MNKINYLSILLLLISTTCFSQNSIEEPSKQRNDCPAFFEFLIEDFTEAEDCLRAKKCAEKDIENEVYIIYTTAGMIPRSEKEIIKINKYQKKYNIKYQNFGCVAPNYNCAKNYNAQVFDYLNLEYGKSWMKKIDQYVIGFTEWKTENEK